MKRPAAPERLGVRLAHPAALEPAVDPQLDAADAQPLVASSCAAGQEATRRNSPRRFSSASSSYWSGAPPGCRMLVKPAASERLLFGDRHLDHPFQKRRAMTGTPGKTESVDICQRSTSISAARAPRTSPHEPTARWRRWCWMNSRYERLKMLPRGPCGRGVQSHLGHRRAGG